MVSNAMFWVFHIMKLCRNLAISIFPAFLAGDYVWDSKTSRAVQVNRIGVDRMSLDY